LDFVHEDRRLTTTHKPRLACEITPERVIAARATDSGHALDVFVARSLPAGVLHPGMGGANVTNAAALRNTVADALSAVGTRSRDIILVVPDAAIRVALLDFEELPEKRLEADSVVRFRLKKSLPFDVEQAALSYDVRRANGGSIKAVAAVAPLAVLSEYEAPFREAGYTPGVVLPSMLAALGPVTASSPTLVIKVDSSSTSVAIVQDEQLLLYRTLENPRGGQLTAEGLAEDIYPSLVFFQDNYGMNVERILLGGLVSARDLGPALETHTGARVSDLVSPAQVGQHSELSPSVLAAVIGALLG
jgi:type IV pilus assembly protein PilM